MQMLRIESLNISRVADGIKKPVQEASVTTLGIDGDINAGRSHRQINLLAAEEIEQFGGCSGLSFSPAASAANIITRGMDLGEAAILDRFAFADVELEVTQTGQTRGPESAPSGKSSESTAPACGVFTRVLNPGKLVTGMTGRFIPRPLRILIITLSDRASAGIYEDRSGPAIGQVLEEHFRGTREHLAIERVIIPDDPERFKRHLREAVDSGVDFVLSTGSTGLGPRDIAPDVTRKVIEKELPGLMEYIRMKYGQQKLAAVMSRGLAGSAGSTFIMNAPGSVRGATEYASEFVKVRSHIRNMIHSIDAHC